MSSLALVTGGGSGIGAGIALALARSGITPVLVGRRMGSLAQVQDHIRELGLDAHAVAWDIGNGDSAGQLVEHIESTLGAVDVLVHAAGNQHRAPALEFPIAEWDAIHGLHLRAAFSLSQAVGRALVAAGRPGSLIFIGSMTSERIGLPDIVAYAAAKSGLLGLMRTLAVEWAPHGIRSNAILVGFVDTEMTRDVAHLPERRALISRVPLGSTGSPDNIGHAAAFLASPSARYVTGSCLTVDGGWSIA
jgi:NAD(P)-dependent dehydrogenase (short-subunit alcohol dehydrogenase family)